MIEPAATSEVEARHLGTVQAGLLAVAVMLAVMWAVEVVDLLPGTSIDRWGVRPRSLRGLLGIVLAPFLHVSFRHLIGNTIPFAVLGAAIALGGVRQFAEVTVITAVVSGLGIWLFGGGSTVHLGASGLVFGFLGYLVARGLVARNPWWIAGGLLVLFFYGGLLWGLLPTSRISWLGHVFGGMGGALAAWVLHGDHADPPEAAMTSRT